MVMFAAFAASFRLSAAMKHPSVAVASHPLWPYRKKEPENLLPPSLGTWLTRMPLLWISADSEPVL